MKDMNILKTDGLPLNNSILDGNQKKTINTNKDYLLLNEKKKDLKNDNVDINKTKEFQLYNYKNNQN